MVDRSVLVGDTSLELPEGWEVKNLSEVCENFDKKRIPITKSNRIQGNIPYYGASGVVDYIDNYIFDDELLLISEDGANLLARTYPIAFSITGKTWVNNHAHVLKFKYTVTQKFIEYYINSISLNDFISGMAQPKLNQKSLNSIPLPIPSLPEQKRIVALLDAAFADIDGAIANTQKNLTNARALFDSTLNRIFSEKGDGWEDTNIGKICYKVEYGSSAKSQKEGAIPVIRMGNIQDGNLDWKKLVFTDNAEEIAKYCLKKNDVLFNRTNSPAHVGKTAIYRGNRKAIFAGYLIRIHRKEEIIDADFLNFYLNSTKVREYGKTIMSWSVNQANINGTKLKQYPISLPSLEKQKEIVKKLARLRRHTQQLEAVYQQKLKNLQELKQSLLQQAFTGALTQTTAKVMQDTRSPEFTANIIAFAFCQHDAQGQQQTFGHVKTQKILHLTETVGKIDLGRSPVKDAAGPNDFPQMLLAEDWAEKNQFFKFQRRDDAFGGYDFIKLDRFDALLKQSKEALKLYKTALETVINLVIDKNTQETEVIATVHAAWNNLLHDDVKITEEAILYEARENWRPEKLKIPEQAFRDAIKFIEQNNIIPDGKAAPVRAPKSDEAQGNLDLDTRRKE